MGRDLGLDKVVDHFTLSGDEAGWLRNKTGATRLGFAVQLKFLTWRGRFPKMRLELPPDAVEHVAKQVGVAAAELGFYDFTSRAAKRHRSELRDLTGWHECTATDQVKLASQLADVIWHDERREEQVRAELTRQMREDLIEPPTAAQINTVIRSSLHQSDERAVTEVAARLAREEDCPRRPGAGRRPPVVAGRQSAANSSDRAHVGRLPGGKAVGRAVGGPVHRRALPPRSPRQRPRTADGDRRRMPRHGDPAPHPVRTTS